MQNNTKKPVYPILINPVTLDGNEAQNKDGAPSPSTGDGPPTSSAAAQTLAPENRGKTGDPPPYKRKKALNETAPPGMEGWVLRRKHDFRSRYGDRADEVLYATAWKIHKKKELNESAEFDDIAAEFISFASAHLDLDTVPPITFKSTEPGSTFATWSPEGITVSVTERHPMDVFRSLAHELVHQKQHETNVLHAESGQTGSEHENEANAMAGVIMRDFAKANPSMFGLKSIAEGFFGKTRRRRATSQGLDKVLARAVDAKIKEKSAAANHQRKLELIAAKAKTKVSDKKAVSAPTPAPTHEKEINNHYHQIDRMVVARDKAVEGSTTRLSVDGKTHDVPNKQFYQSVANWHQKALKTRYGLDAEVKPPPTNVGAPIKRSKKPPPALAEDVSSREKTCLLRKSHMHKLEYETLLEVYLRGLNDWDYSQTLTREQYAFNRVNSFVAGGKAAFIDEDLKKETQ